MFLLAHMRHHAGIRLYTCMKCDKSFNTKSNLKMHMKSHYPESKDGNVLFRYKLKFMTWNFLFSFVIRVLFASLYLHMHMLAFHSTILCGNSICSRILRFQIENWIYILDSEGMLFPHFLCCNDMVYTFFSSRKTEDDGMPDNTGIDH